MRDRIVDVFLNGTLLASYRFPLAAASESPCDSYLMELAQSAMRKEGRSWQDIAEATYSVRSIELD